MWPLLLFKVLEVLPECSMHAHIKKYKFVQSSILFLGHVVSNEGVSPDTRMTEKVVSFAIPCNVPEVLSFWGVETIFSKFVPNFALHAAPLFNLLKKSFAFVWTEASQAGFEYIKSKLEDSEILVKPHFDKPLTSLPLTISCLHVILLSKDVKSMYWVTFYGIYRP